MNTIAKKNIFALVAVLAGAFIVLAYAAPASAFFGGGNNSGDDNDIKIEISNSATVNNTVEVEAETGDNEADGGDGEEGGNGGDAEGEGDNNGGDGGNGGHGALGGFITTGDATAYATVLNEVNVNKTRVRSSCGCPDEEEQNPWSFFFGRGDRGGDDNEIKVEISNSATVGNDVEVEAETGDNEADGGDGEEGGNGGDAEGDDNKHRRSNNHFFWFWPNGGDDNGENNGGEGGQGGNGGVGGDILTGDAQAAAEVVNVVNRNVTRVTR